MTPTRRYRCRFCGRLLSAWLPVAREPDSALLLGHLAQAHRNQVGAYLARMHTQTASKFPGSVPCSVKEKVMEFPAKPRATMPWSVLFLPSWCPGLHRVTNVSLQGIPLR
jgi:hypothetical protein